MHRLQLGEAPQLEKVNQSGEFKRGTIGEAQETYRIETFGKVIGITRQVLINDDLDAFTRAGALRHLGGDAGERRRLGHLHRQPGDGRRHDALPRQPQEPRRDRRGARRRRLAKARTAMAQQRGLDGKTLLNVRPSYLVVPSALEPPPSSCWRRTSCRRRPRTWCLLDPQPRGHRRAAARSGERRGAVVPVASPAAIDTIEYAYLEGQEGVALETRMGFDVDGVEVRARLDFGAKAIDWRGLYKNPGVALS